MRTFDRSAGAHWPRMPVRCAFPQSLLGWISQAYHNGWCSPHTSCCPPAAPSALTATAASPMQIDLSWTDNSDDESGFSIECSPDGTSGWSERGWRVSIPCLCGHAEVTSIQCCWDSPSPSFDKAPGVEASAGNPRRVLTVARTFTHAERFPPNPYRRLARAVGGRPYSSPPRGHPAYHRARWLW